MRYFHIKVGRWLRLGGLATAIKLVTGFMKFMTPTPHCQPINLECNLFIYAQTVHSYRMQQQLKMNYPQTPQTRHLHSLIVATVAFIVNRTIMIALNIAWRLFISELLIC
jgi:hypothetical protein